MTARTGRDPGMLYRDLTRDRGDMTADRVEAPATAEQKKKLAGLSPQQVRITEMAGEPIKSVLTKAPGNNAPIGGIKVISEGRWFAVRPYGTDDIDKVYAESFRGEGPCALLLPEAATLLDVQ